MRRVLIIAIVLTIGSASFAVAAQPKNVSVGVILGQPTGLSAKLWLNQTSAIDVAAAWNFLPVGSVYVQADYLYHIYHLFGVKKGKLPLYFGVGGTFSLQPTPTIGLRVPVGVEYLLPNAPIDLFLEVGVGISLYPATQFQGSGGLGIRYTF